MSLRTYALAGVGDEPRPGSPLGGAGRRGERAVIALARANGLLGTGRALTAQPVAEELDVSLGALAVTEHELARALNLERYTHRPGAA